MILPAPYALQPTPSSPLPSDSKPAPSRRLTFANVIERVCLFEKSTSPASIASSARFNLQDIDDWDATSVSAALAACQEFVIVSTNFSSMHSACYMLSSVALDHVSLEHNVLRLSVLVRNLAFDKLVSIRYTQDAWTSQQDMSCCFAGVVTPSAFGGYVGIDRFEAEINLADTPAASLDVEFAIQYTVGNETFWDNHGNQNYKIYLERPSQPVSSTPASPLAHRYQLDAPPRGLTTSPSSQPTSLLSHSMKSSPARASASPRPSTPPRLPSPASLTDFALPRKARLNRRTFASWNTPLMLSSSGHAAGPYQSTYSAIDAECSVLPISSPVFIEMPMSSLSLSAVSATPISIPQKLNDFSYGTSCSPPIRA